MHSQDISEVMKQLFSAGDGLSSEEAQKRLEKYGKNELGDSYKRTAWGILTSQFKNFLFFLLIAAVIISLAIGHTIDAIAISVAILLSVGFGFFLEYRADKSLEALKSIAESEVVVKRDGANKLVSSLELVPGDIVYLTEGSKISADARLLSALELEVNEAYLTGESRAIRKAVDVLQENTILAERKNMVYSGSFVTKGEGSAIVVATGNLTELGKISSALAKVESGETVLQRSLNDLGKKVSIASILIIILLFAVGLLQQKNPVDLFVLSVSLAVAAVPEGLITVLTIILALGVRRMAEHNALVRNIQSVETLGTSTVLVVDKTGTLTLGKMKLTTIFTDNSFYGTKDVPKKNKSIFYSILCTYAKVTDKGFFGDEMDKSILESGESLGFDVREIKDSNQPIEAYPFDNEKKRMKMLFNISGKEVMIMKGAPERIISLCHKADVNGKIVDFDKKELDDELLKFTSDGLRVLALAYRKNNSKDIIFLALLGFQDPPRKNVLETLNEAKSQGLRIIMLTGDNLETAISIGKQVCLVTDESQAVLWKSLEQLDDKQLKQKLSNISIIARSTSLSKLRIVEMLIQMGEIVAVTGDGVNDAPALKKAHVGVVMGSGTDVSKEAGKLILMDDDLSTLIAAIRYGRTVFSNIISFIRFQFTTNVSTLLLFITTFFAGIPSLLTPVQILFINIIMDGPPALALGFEDSANTNKVHRKIFSKNVLCSIAVSAVFMVLVTLYIFSSFDPQKVLTGTFVVFVLMQLFNSLNCRSLSNSFFYKPQNNKYIFGTFFAMLAILYLIVELPFFETYMGTTGLSPNEWIYLLAISASVLVLEEVKKRVFKRYFLQEE
ncbi:MAG: cation-transporting P-type ATPase [Candidatus Micrarchaeota archaeon]